MIRDVARCVSLTHTNLKGCSKHPVCPMATRQFSLEKQYIVHNQSITVKGIFVDAKQTSVQMMHPCLI